VIRNLGFDELESHLAYDVWRLRQEVFVVEQGSIYRDLDGRDVEPTTRHLVLIEDDVVVGYLRVLDESDSLRIGRVAVATAARGRHLGDQLMSAALTHIADRPARLDAQTGLARWYATYGFEVSGPEFDDEGVWHLPMVKGAEATR